MSELAARAIAFYLSHPEVVDETEALHGRTHQVYACPECATSVAVRDGELVSLSNQPGVVQEATVEQVASTAATQEGQKLVPCLS
jgi:hypothetical protein